MIKHISVFINSYKIIKIIMFMLYNCCPTKTPIKTQSNTHVISLQLHYIINMPLYALISQFNIILPIKNYLSQGN